MHIYPILHLTNAYLPLDPIYGHPLHELLQVDYSSLCSISLVMHQLEINQVHYWIILTVQWSVTYPDPTFPDYSLIWTQVWEPIIVMYRESDSLIQKFSYPDSHLGNRGVWISQCPLYISSLETRQLFCEWTEKYLLNLYFPLSKLNLYSTHFEFI